MPKHAKQKNTKQKAKTEPPPEAKTPRTRPPQIRIDVSQANIDEGVRHSGSHCMIREAIHDKYPNARNILVDLQTIRFTDKKEKLRYIWLTPRTALVSLIRWDDGIKLKPFHFRLTEGQVVSARTRGSDGKEKPHHNLGKKTIRLHKRAHKQRPNIVGGKPPPLHKFSQRREFGLRSITREDIKRNDLNRRAA
jgi:hypothetical protein